MEFAEVRHLDGIVGNFGVSERDYIAAISGNTNKADYADVIKARDKTPLMQPLFEAVYSNVKEFVQHQQFFFETLWNRAIPAEQRIREIEEGVLPEKTEILYGLENIINRIIQTMPLIKKGVDNCGDSNLPGIFVSTLPVMNAYKALKSRGIRLRFITEITKGNISDCKKIMEFAELRHLDGVKGNIGVTDNEFMANAAVPKAPEPLQQVVYSTVRAFVEQQQYSFQNLWDKAVPADQKIREIEEGIEPEVIETMRDPVRIQELGFELARLAQKEVSVIFSTSNAFYRQERAGMFQLFRDLAISEPDLKFRILAPMDTKVKVSIDRWNEDSGLRRRIDVRYMPPPTQTRVSILIIDRKFSLVVELNDDTKKTSLESIGLGTYSNSKPTVLSYVSIFESLWIQTDLNEQIKDANEKLRVLYDRLQTHDKAQEEFINVAAHELRAPLQPILGLAEVLASENTSQKQRKLLNMIIQSAQRLQQLTDNVLDVTRIEGNSLVLKREMASITDIIIEVIRGFENQIDKTGVKLVLKKIGHSKRPHIDDTLLFIDRGRISQVMTNLLSNAVKFSKKGVVTITVKKMTSQVLVSIKDTGPGIDSEILPRLFTKFATKSERGTGLGLFISKSIIEAHDGKIRAENHVNGGAIFTFVLPIKRPTMQLPSRQKQKGS